MNVIYHASHPFTPIFNEFILEFDELMVDFSYFFEDLNNMSAILITLQRASKKMHQEAESARA